MNCIHCGKPLNEAQFHGNLKSCPSCSVNNGNEHIYYLYPETFGKTELRATSKRPDGPQSYCTACRGGKEQTEHSPILCSNI
jgi:phage FluMu protein Com